MKNIYVGLTTCHQFLIIKKLSEFVQNGTVHRIKLSNNVFVYIQLFTYKTHFNLDRFHIVFKTFSVIPEQMPRTIGSALIGVTIERFFTITMVSELPSMVRSHSICRQSMSFTYPHVK